MPTRHIRPVCPAPAGPVPRMGPVCTFPRGRPGMPVRLVCGRFPDASGNVELGALALLDAVGAGDLAPEVRATLGGKADRATTLAGYGILDAYTRTEADAAISSAISAVKDSAPEAFDTLKEIADWIGDDQSGAQTLINQVSNKVDKVPGKGLSTNDYTAAEKAKLGGVEAGAKNNVVEAASASAFPATGEEGKIYVAEDTNKTYRWSGTQYVEVSPSPVPVAPSTDASAQGKPADAKATGDALAARPTKAQLDAGWWSEWTVMCNGVDVTSDVPQPEWGYSDVNFWIVPIEHPTTQLEGVIYESSTVNESLTVLTWTSSAGNWTATRHRVSASVPTKPSDIGAASVADATLTPQLGTWTILRNGVDVTSQVAQPVYYADMEVWSCGAVSGDVDLTFGYATSGETNADNTSIGWSAEGGVSYTATRTVVGYQLGGQTTKPLQPRGDYATVAGATLTPHFGEWTISPSGRFTEVLWTDNWGQPQWALSIEGPSGYPVSTGNSDPYATNISATDVGGTVYTATRAVVSYTMGSQTGKPLQPQGDYASTQVLHAGLAKKLGPYPFAEPTWSEDNGTNVCTLAPFKNNQVEPGWTFTGFDLSIPHSLSYDSGSGRWLFTLGEGADQRAEYAAGSENALSLSFTVDGVGTMTATRPPSTFTVSVAASPVANTMRDLWFVVKAEATAPTIAWGPEFDRFDGGGAAAMAPAANATNIYHLYEYKSGKFAIEKQGMYAARAEIETGWWSEWTFSGTAPQTMWRVVWISDNIGYGLYDGDSLVTSNYTAFPTDAQDACERLAFGNDVTATRHWIAGPVPQKPSDIGAAGANVVTFAFSLETWDQGFRVNGSRVITPRALHLGFQYNHIYSVTLSGVRTLEPLYDSYDGESSDVYVNGQSIGKPSAPVAVTVDGSVVSCQFRSCLSPDTSILMADGSSKRLDEVKTGDLVRSVDPATGEVSSDRVVEVAHGTGGFRDVWTFGGGRTVVTVGRHRFWNVDLGEFMYLEAWNRGESARLGDGGFAKLVGRVHEDGEFPYATLYTEKWNNYFAGGLLAGNRLSAKGDFRWRNT